MCRKLYRWHETPSTQNSVLFLSYYKVDLASALVFFHLCVKAITINTFLVRTFTGLATFSFGWNLKWTLLYYMKENLLSILLGVKQFTSFSKLLSSWPLNTKFVMNVRIQISQESSFRRETVIGTDYPHYRLCCCLLE